MRRYDPHGKNAPSSSGKEISERFKIAKGLGVIITHRQAPCPSPEVILRRSELATSWAAGVRIIEVLVKGRYNVSVRFDPNTTNCDNLTFDRCKNKGPVIVIGSGEFQSWASGFRTLTVGARHNWEGILCVAMNLNDIGVSKEAKQ
jgi:hypothetical protein